MTRKEFLEFLGKSLAMAGASSYLNGIEKAMANSSTHKYFIGVMAHSLGLLFPSRPTTLHGDFFTSYGNWRFNGPGTLSEFDQIKSHLIVPRGLTYRMNSGIEDVGHFQAQGAFLTGYPSRSASLFDRLVNSNHDETAPSQVQSIDWIIAKRYGFQPVALGYRDRQVYNGAEAPHFFRAISWSGPESAFYPVFDSAALQTLLKNRLNCTLYNNDSDLASKLTDLNHQKTLLSNLEKSYVNHLRVDRSYADTYDVYIQDFRNQARIYQKDIDNISSNLNEKERLSPLCDMPQTTYSSATPSGSDENYYFSKMSELNSLTARCFQVGLTNAVTMSVVLESRHHSQHYISDLDLGRDGQTETSITTNREALKSYMAVVGKSLTHLVEELKARKIFDQTLILVSGEQTDGNTHRAPEAPLLVIDGSKNTWNGASLGDDNMMRETPLENRPYSDLLVDVLKKFGISVSEFGSPYNVKGVGRGGLF